MSTTIQPADNQQTQVKKAKVFVASWVPAGALGGAAVGYHFARPWMKGGHVSDSFVKEAAEQFYKGLSQRPKQVPSPSTIIDHLTQDELKNALEGCFKDLKKGTLKSKEELVRILAELNINADARPGDLHLLDWQKLHNAIYK